MLKNTNDIKSIDKKWRDVAKTISYKVQFTDSTRFMTSSLSNLVDNFAEGIHKIKYKNERYMWSVWN